MYSQHQIQTNYLNLIFYVTHKVNNAVIEGLFSPPLTVVSQPAYRLGQIAAQLLMKMINGESAEAPLPLQVELVVRASCAALPING